MKSIKSLTSPIIAIICVIISLFFPEIRTLWIGPIFNAKIEIVLVFLGLFIGLTTVGILLIAKYLGSSLLKMEKHMVIQAFETQNRYVLWFVFPSTMVFEEVLFRGFLIYGLSTISSIGQFGSIIISSFIFSLYHLHTWPSFKDKKITSAFMVFSLFLGFACGFFVFAVGLIGVLLLHWLSVFLIFHDMRTKMSRFKPKLEELCRDVLNNYAAGYLNFTSILSGISFAILFNFLGQSNSTWFDTVIIVSFSFATTCFLLATAGYADCTKIKANKIRRQIMAGKWEEIPCDFYANVHLADQFTLVGFFSMIIALGISGFKNVYAWWWGTITIAICIIALIGIFRLLPSHGKEKN